MYAIGLLHEKLVLLSDCRKLPGKPKKTTVMKWRIRGCINQITRQRHYIETVKIGGQLWTSEEAYQRFMEKLNEGEA